MTAEVERATSTDTAAQSRPTGPAPNGLTLLGANDPGDTCTDGFCAGP